MAEPTAKHKDIRQMQSDLAGRDIITSIKGDTCVWCGKPAMEFTDDISRREFRISGQCQACQDISFAEPEED